MTNDVKKMRKESIDEQLKNLNYRISKLDITKLDGRQLNWIVLTLTNINSKINHFLK